MISDAIRKAYSVAIVLHRDATLTKAQRADVQQIIYGLEAAKTSHMYMPRRGERRPITLEAHFGGIDRDIEEKLKPSLKKVVDEVFGEFIASLEISVKESNQ